MTYAIEHGSDRARTARALAYGLGWFSLVLGAAELLAPRPIKQGIGARSPAALLQGYGVREIAAGAAILASDEPNKMVWGRVAGDVLDLATLAPTMRADNPKRPAAAGALAFVLLATVADIAVAMQDGRRGYPA
jgi:hypothetical protein